MTPTADAEPLLSGLRILDLSTMIAGPYGSMLLADMGADVVKVEPPHGDSLRLSPPKHHGVSMLWSAVNRNKRCIIVDLQRPRGRELVLQMVPHFDIVYSNYRPDVMDRLGLSFDALCAVNPRVIVANVSGFGNEGPRRMAPAYDTTIQGLSGGMSLTGHAGQPPARSGIPIADLGGGAFLAMSVLAALHKRDRTGRPVQIDLSLLDIQVSLLMYWSTIAMNLGIEPGPQGSGNMSSCPYGAYRTADGHVIVGVYNHIFWPRFCDVIGHPELVDDPRFVDNEHRVQNRAILEGLINAEMSQQPSAHWLARLDEHDVPHGPVNSVMQAMADPQVAARNMRLTIPVDGVPWEFPGDPIKTVPDSSAAGDVPPPRLGQHTAEVLDELLGVDARALEALVAEGIVFAEDPAQPRWAGSQYSREG